MSAGVHQIAGTDVDGVRFTYSSPHQNWLQRTIIRGIETLTGQPKLARLYRAWTEAPLPGENLFSAGIRLLEIKLEIDRAALAAVPRQGPVLFVANHPFGVIDGLAMGHLTTMVRPDTKIMTHSLLCQAREARDYLLPVDFSGTDEAARITMHTRRRAMEWLSSGHAMVVFPGGVVSTSQKPFSGPALESAWHPFVGKLAKFPGVTVVPVYFHGQNSRLFQMASHLSYSMRIALLFRESMRMSGDPLKVEIGKPILPGELAGLSDRNDVIREIRRRTLSLANHANDDSMAEFQWPAHIRWN